MAFFEGGESCRLGGLFFSRILNDVVYYSSQHWYCIGIPKMRTPFFSDCERVRKFSPNMN